jgi:hypothetical protein
LTPGLQHFGSWLSNWGKVYLWNPSGKWTGLIIQFISGPLWAE